MPNTNGAFLIRSSKATRWTSTKPTFSPPKSQVTENGKSASKTQNRDKPASCNLLAVTDRSTMATQTKMPAEITPPDKSRTE